MLIFLLLFISICVIFHNLNVVSCFNSELKWCSLFIIIWKSSSIITFFVILISLTIFRALHATTNFVLKISNFCFNVNFWLCYFFVFFCQIISALFLSLFRHESSDQSIKFSWESSSDSKTFFRFWIRIWFEKSFTSEIKIFSKFSEKSVFNVFVSCWARCCFRVRKHL